MADSGANLVKQQSTRSTYTFDFGVTNRVAAAYTVFTVSGLVMIEFMSGFCSEDLVGATATVEVGIAGDTAGLIAQTTATDLDNGDAWVAAAPAGVVETAIENKIVAANVILTVGVATITEGTLTIICEWRPMTIAPASLLFVP